MISFRVIAPVEAMLIFQLTAMGANACTCGEAPQNAFPIAYLVVKDRMKTVTYGDQYSAGDSKGGPLRFAWGKVEVEKVLERGYSE